MFCKCFSWSHCSHLNRSCGKITKLCSFIVQKYKLKRNHQDETCWPHLFVTLIQCFKTTLHWSHLYLIHSWWFGLCELRFYVWIALFSHWLNSYLVTSHRPRRGQNEKKIDRSWHWCQILKNYVQGHHKKIKNRAMRAFWEKAFFVFSPYGPNADFWAKNAVFWP